MKDKKLKILLGLASAWILLFGMTILTKSPRVEGLTILIAIICIGWFAYWTLLTMRSYFKKEVPPVQPTQPTQPTNTNASTKKTPKSD